MGPCRGEPIALHRTVPRRGLAGHAIGARMKSAPGGHGGNSLRPRPARRCACLVLSLLVCAAVRLTAADDLAARTIILVNSRQPDSVELGEYYAAQRAIPRENIVALPLPPTESITWREFVDQVWQPLQDELHRRGWLEGSLSSQLDALGRRKSALTGHRIAYLVTCRGTPLRIHDDPTAFEPAQAARVPQQFRRNQAAVDSELSLLAQRPQATVGFVPNPLFRTKAAADISADFVVKVSRLDGPSAADARALVSSALEAEKFGLIGRYYVDLGGPHAVGDRWLEATRERLGDLGFFGEVERTGRLFDAADRFDAPVLYFGWYASTVSGPFLREEFRFPPGAIALHIHSFSAAGVRSSTDQWCGPLVARGVAATFGNVFEPYLEFTLRPDLLLEQLAAGATLGDAAYYATPVLGWQGLVIGDPLYRPFKVSLPDQLAQLAALPASLAGHVVARQAAVLDRLGMSDEARALFARGMREAPSLALALASARFELAQKRPAVAVGQLGFVANLRDISPVDWPLVRAAGEFVAANGAAREALPIYQALVRAKAPSLDAALQVLADAKKIADTTGNLALSLEFAKKAIDLAPPPAPPAASGPK
ncbi:MAG: TIGR03790 family protein [Opitutus sp.]|nr:TIGR03790 family protein [Opitutus sp.]